MAPVARSTHVTPTVVWLRYVLRRYQRDVALMTGAVAPTPEDLDDTIILEHFVHSPDGQAVIGDRKLRIKTLEAMIELLEETPDQSAGHTAQAAS